MKVVGVEGGMEGEKEKGGTSMETHRCVVVGVGASDRLVRSIGD